MSPFGKGREWYRAPIAGSTIIVCYVGAVISLFWIGSTEKMLLWMLMAEVVGIRRDKYLEDTKDD